MTKQEISNYVSQQHVGHSKDSQVTRIFLKNGEIHLTFFLMENQKPELMQENKWIVLPRENVTGYVVLNGDDVRDLKSGAKHFG